MVYVRVPGTARTGFLASHAGMPSSALLFSSQSRPLPLPLTT
jgi:hypothetical protein